MSQAESKKKILIIDDEKSITILLSGILKKDYLTQIAHNSRDAILSIHNFQPDLITSDIKMPGLDGDALLPIIRAWKPLIPVLVISGSLDPDIHQKCLERGASSFIAKPFERLQLLEQVQKILDGKVPSTKVSENIMSEVELAIITLEREGLFTREQSKEELNKVKIRMKKQMEDN
jgi:DNA-binding NtrC family response regulator